MQAARGGALRQDSDAFPSLLTFLLRIIRINPTPPPPPPPPPHDPTARSGRSLDFDAPPP